MTADLPRAERLIAEHTPSPAGDCMCGWSQHSRRGISHTAHVVQVLASAQLLACYTPDTASRTIRLSLDRSDSMTTDRTITLTAEQVRRVLVGLVTTDDTRRAFAVTAMADALIVADEPAPAFVAEQVNEAVDQPQAVDPGRERRVAALVTAVGQMLDEDGAYSVDSLMHVVDNALTALTTYSRPSAPAPAEPALAPMSSVRAELHALAPLPWTVDPDGDVWDARGRYQFFPQGGAASDRARRAELVARVVNEPEPATAPVSDERTRAVDEVLAAARSWVDRRDPGHDDVELRRAVRALDGSGGAA